MLSLVERHVGPREIRAGVDQLVVEPLPVEGVTEIVVTVHVVASGPQRIGDDEHPSKPGLPGRRQGQSRQRLDDRFERPADFEAARHIGLAEPEMRVDGQTEKRPPVVDDQVADSWTRVVVRRTAIPELEPDCTGGNCVLDSRRQPSIAPADAAHCLGGPIRGADRGNAGCAKGRMSVGAHAWTPSYAR